MNARGRYDEARDDGGEYVACFACGGTGDDDTDALGECCYCSGTGEQLVFRDDPDDDDQRDVEDGGPR